MSSEYDVVVVGGGLAGMTAALTSARLGRRTALVTGNVIGGQLVSIDKIEGVPGFPEGVPGYDLCPMAQEQADAAGVEFMATTCESIASAGDGWSITSDGTAVTARGVIIATGTVLAKLGVPGEERLFGKGVSECASCDAPLLRNKIAVVAGGGDSAMQEALTLADHVSKVIVIERGGALTGQAAYRDRVTSNPKIELRFGATVTEVSGDQTVSHVRVKDLASDAETVLEASAIFVFTGLVPNTELFREIVKFDETGRVAVDGTLRSSAKGIAAAGNVRSGSPHRAAGAMGDGATAAIAIDRYLTTGKWRSPA
jgi:thioredoxin reductase (NADPH)